MSNETTAVSIESIAARSLGSANSYAVYTDKYDPSVLNFMPRSAARSQWGITGEEFDGYDLWHCYEATFMLASGQPVAGTLKLKFPVSNPDVVESKSLKLYLNTFDMCRMGNTFLEAIRNYEQQIAHDLRAGGLECEVRFFSGHVLTSAMRNHEQHPLSQARLIDVTPDVVFDDFTGQGSYIQPHQPGSFNLVITNILRSRCRHTKQKDSGSAVFSLGGRLDQVNLLKQVVSLREVNEFHEFCAEKLFVEVSKGYEGAGVFLIYSRRGSLDIHPVRYAKDLHEGHITRVLADKLGSMKYLHHSIMGQ